MMIVIVLVVATLVARLIGAEWVGSLNSWPAAVRGGLAVMLCFTASAHFNSMRHELARMVPRAVPRPMAVIYFTGVCEILGGIGLLVPATRLAAAIALIVMFVALLPANIRAAREGMTLRGKPVTPLIWRIPMQVVFIVLTWWAGTR
jgi:uncharacterized membrane protein